MNEKLIDNLEAEYTQALADLKEMVKLPTVAWPGFDAKALDESAKRLREMFFATGLFEKVEIFGYEEGFPAIFAERPAAEGYPTVILYAHHDVQPPGDASKWDSPAFEPQERNDRLYGRGSADDKAGVAVHLAVARLIQKINPDIKVGVKVFIEGEEEVSSPSFGRMLEDKAEFFNADVMIVADGDNPGVDTPGLTVSLRGNAVASIRVKTLSHASHSGMFGGAIPDAMMAMVRLLDSLYDQDGSVAVAGLVREEKPESVYDEAKVREVAGVLPGVKLTGRGSMAARMWHAPSITIIGLDAVSVDKASNTVQPEITARISLRVAPGQKSAEAIRLLEEHLQQNAPFGAQVEIYDVETGDPYEVPAGGWARQLMNQSLSASWQTPAIEVGLGGSIPMVSVLSERFSQLQVLVTGIEDPSTMAHSPNESLSLKVFKRAIAAETDFLLAVEEKFGASNE